ncbi:phage replisome organizer N-terminal domain-containing protein (plasmid) [Bacillus carboniphilus]|uniref:Phage replisome organizer N-terminal domain-containing protein n=1 Tax=Bacillus carboniphilus TaxID=86663 RepID=A0ABY9JYF7_9BACI|nr:phage replisome organizer N-terminal domain-containing protein [Bacillus carboniphilus]WLR44419.1 phage replisome organizer N-terminal domain-containing protein [Bacillus carboniphilus]
MAEVTWIRLNISMFDDEKIKLIESMPESDTILIIWIKLLSLAGKTNSQGYILLSESLPYTDEMLSTLFNRPLSTVRLALETFKRFGMIHYEDEVICITNWEKHQNADGLIRIREQNRLRKQRERERKKLSRDVTEKVTPSHATDKDIDIDKEYIYTIFKHWSEKDIINHRSITKQMESHIRARLKEYSLDELKKAINNFAEILHSDNYYWTHKWTLADFMKPNNLVKFIDESTPHDTYKTNKVKRMNKKQNDIDWEGFDVDEKTSSGAF